VSIVVGTGEMVDFSGFTAVWAKNERACQSPTDDIGLGKWAHSSMEEPVEIGVWEGEEGGRTEVLGLAELVEGVEIGVEVVEVVGIGRVALLFAYTDMPLLERPPYPPIGGASNKL
jgi:hypothetical protein